MMLTMKISLRMMWPTWSNSSSGICLSHFWPANWVKPSSTFTNVRNNPSLTLSLFHYPPHAERERETERETQTIFLSLSDVPKEQRLQAVQAAIMLMSDENREVLQTLLCFLSDVTSSVQENQMTPMNLAVCLAPSLFHLNILKKDNLAPR